MPESTSNLGLFENPVHYMLTTSLVSQELIKARLPSFSCFFFFFSLHTISISIHSLPAIEMDQETTLQIASQLQAVADTLETLHAKQSNCQFLISEIQKDNIIPGERLPPTYAAQTYASIKAITLERLFDSLTYFCTKINEAESALDKLSPPPTIYFKRQRQGRQTRALNATFRLPPQETATDESIVVPKRQKTKKNPTSHLFNTWSLTYSTV